jgi:hypothetical protein
MPKPSATPLPNNPDPADVYQAAFDALGKAYWDASDIQSKDLVQGARDAIGDIITAIDEEELATNTALFVQLAPKIKDINTALKKIQADITNITKNINTAASVISTISQVLSLFPALA